VSERIDYARPGSDTPIAVLLLNLGTPDSPAVSDVRRYLREFLSDPRVLDLPPGGPLDAAEPHHPAVSTREVGAPTSRFGVKVPTGLTFRPAENAPRRVWAISGTARLDSLKLSSDPSGIRNRFPRFHKNQAGRDLGR
jgi:hypothetical protein